MVVKNSLYVFGGHKISEGSFNVPVESIERHTGNTDFEIVEITGFYHLVSREECSNFLVFP